MRFILNRKSEFIIYNIKEKKLKLLSLNKSGSFLTV